MLSPAWAGTSAWYRVPGLSVATLPSLPPAAGRQCAIMSRGHGLVALLKFGTLEGGSVGTVKLLLKAAYQEGFRAPNSSLETPSQVLLPSAALGVPSTSPSSCHGHVQPTL